MDTSQQRFGTNDHPSSCAGLGVVSLFVDLVWENQVRSFIFIPIQLERSSANAYNRLKYPVRENNRGGVQYFTAVRKDEGQ